MKNKETLKQIVINYIDNKIITLIKDIELSIVKAIEERGKQTRNHVTKETKTTRKYIGKFSKKLNPISKDVKEILESQKRIETKIDYLYNQLNIKYEEDKRTNVEILKSFTSL